MQVEDQVDPLQQQTVELLIAIAPRRWKRIFCDFEWHEDATTFMSSDITIAVVKKLLGGVESVSIDLDDDMRLVSNFKQIAVRAMQRSGTRQCTLDLIVRSATDHDWYSDFGPPPRLSSTLAGDVEAEYKNPALQKPYRKFAAQDEWLAKIS